MNISVELYPKRFGDNNVTEMLRDKECGVLIGITSDPKVQRNEFILTMEESKELIRKIEQSLEAMKRIAALEFADGNTDKITDKITIR